MKYKIKITSVCIVVLLCVGLTGCGNEDRKTESKSAGKCTIMVECSTVSDNVKQLDKAVKDYIPPNGMILEKKQVEFFDNESVYDVLSRELKSEGILIESSFTGNSAYIEGINNLYEFSCGDLSGWMYSVNGEYQNISSSEYKLKDGDEIEWHYTCDLGEDLKN